jgi:hypothetical protein
VKKSIALSRDSTTIPTLCISINLLCVMVLFLHEVLGVSIPKVAL